MSKAEKLLARLIAAPTDFSWKELETVLQQLGYSEMHAGKTSGSRRRFNHATVPPIFLHEPHPRKILKAYQVKLVLEHLQAAGLI